MIARRLAAVTTAAVLLVACGDGDGGRYDAQVDQVRQAVQAGDREAALTSLEELNGAAFAAHADGEVSDEDLFELSALVDQARAQVDAELPEPTTTTTTTTTTTPPAAVFDAGSSDEGDDDDEKEDKKKNRGNGRDDDDGRHDDD